MFLDTIEAQAASEELHSLALKSLRAVETIQGLFSELLGITHLDAGVIIPKNKRAERTFKRKAMLYFNKIQTQLPVETSMFKPLSMQRVSLKLLYDDVPAAAAALARHGMFNPDAARLAAEVLPEYPGEAYRALFYKAKQRFGKLCTLLQYTPFPERGFEIVRQEELARVAEKLGAFRQDCAKLEEQRRIWRERRGQALKLRGHLKIFKRLDVDLRLLHKTHTFLTLRAGSLPLVDLERFTQSVQITPGHFIKVFHVDAEQAYLMLAGPPESGGTFDKLLRNTEFHALEVPPEFHDYPDKIEQDLQARRLECDEELSRVEKALRDFRDARREDLQHCADILNRAGAYAELALTLHGARGGLCVLEAWVPARETAGLEAVLEDSVEGRFVLDTRAPFEEEYDEVPSLLEHPPWLRGFQKLVENFGIPRYGEIDPTALFAFSAVLMFGMMFGDVGHGFVIAAAGFFLRRRLGDYAAPVIAAGVSSLLFGFLYGSLFGYETILPAWWLHPLHHPMLLLSVGIFWGVLLIFAVSALKVYNLWVEGRAAQACFDAKGLAGMLFYGAALYALYRSSQGRFGMTEVLLLCPPLLSIMLWKGYTHKAPWGERLIVVGIESFDMLTAYFSNTLSFMRVAAFSLNHAALALAVFALASGMGQFNHWLVVVLGNIFVLLLEGAVVAVQILRLEYYEGFVRFFSGDGKAFRALRPGM